MKYGRAYVNGGFRPAIGKEGPKWTQVVYVDGSTVKVTRCLGNLEFTPLTGYTLQTLASRFLCRKNHFGTKMYISRRARKILKEARL